MVRLINKEPQKIIKEKPPTKPQEISIQEIRVRSRFVRMPPDKIRLVAKTLVGKKIENALAVLEFIPKAATKPLILIVKEARSQAKDKNLDLNNLVIKNIAVNEGPKLKRRRIIHRGRSTTILKRMSHITVVLGADGNHKHQITNPKQITNKQKNKIKK